MEAITAALASNRSLPLERLELNEWTFSATAGDNLAQFIANTTTLKYLSIQRLMCSPHALLVLGRAIHHNSIVQTKNLQNFQLAINSDKEAKDLNQLLVEYPDLVLSCIPVNCSITVTRELDLSCCGVSNAGAEGLAQALHHSTLTQLNLSENSVSGAGAVALAQALHHNSILRELGLSNNSISDAGAKALAQALHHNSILRELDLSNNSISDAGAKALAQALHHNSILRELDLSNNGISDAGAKALAQALHYNSTLTWLDISNNSITDAGAVALAETLHHNSTLTQLDLSGNDGIAEEGTHKLLQALSVNTSISLTFSRRCEEYTNSCPLQYHTVIVDMHRITLAPHRILTPPHQLYYLKQPL